MSATLHAELQTDLDKLHQKVEASRKAGAEQTELDQHTNLFEGEWFERLLRDQKRAAEVATTAIQNALEDRALQQQRNGDSADAQKIPKMTPEKQVAFWMSNHTSSNTNAYRDQEQAREISEAVSKEQKRINAEYETLRQAMIQSVQQIEVGEKPSLTQQIALQLEKETRTISDDDSQSQPLKRSGPKR